MVMVDYAKFLNMLLAEGCAVDGTRVLVLTPQSVRELTYGRFLGRVERVEELMHYTVNGHGSNALE